MNAQAQSVQTPSFDPIELRNVFGQFATGVTVITTVAEDGTLVGLAANSFSSVSLDPALVSWGLDLNAPSLSAFKSHGHFAINIMGEDSKDLVMNFARPSDDKFANVAYTTGRAGLPLLDKANAVLECRTHQTIRGGDHEIFIGEILNFDNRDSQPPLLFHKGTFAKLGEAL